ncbi:hypothetical protein [Phenylobacterium sp.]|uniref:hypothetical protein n=1 Tax=Phenylobacterium sp. TaxID=1871053 RepID=UPI00260C3E11|nr:hypothetical protein [Phenylobacterium sp.]
MNITGESFDYGPNRFLPRNDPTSWPPISTTAASTALGARPRRCSGTCASRAAASAWSVRPNPWSRR